MGLQAGKGILLISSCHLGSKGSLPAYSHVGQGNSGGGDHDFFVCFEGVSSPVFFRVVSGIVLCWNFAGLGKLNPGLTFCYFFGLLGVVICHFAHRKSSAEIQVSLGF